MALLGLASASLTVGFTLSLLVRRRASVVTALFVSFGVAFAALAGAMALDVAGPERTVVVTQAMRAVTLLASTHRRLLVVLPFVSCAGALFVLSVYRERLAEAHAKDYRNVICFCAGIALISTLLTLVETAI
jgi:hypothetical protein